MTNRFILTILLEVFMTYKVNLINSSNQSQLTNTFIKLVQSEIYNLEFRLKHEVNATDINNKKIGYLKHQIISEFKSNIDSLAKHYLSQKASYSVWQSDNDQNNNQTQLNFN